MSLLLWTVFTTSLLGSLHCAGMCGPFVGFYAGTDRNTSLWPHIAYNLGRLFTYATMGAVAGAVGHLVDIAGSALRVQKVSMLLAGGFILLWGLLSLARACNVGKSANIRIGMLGPAKRSLVQLRTRPPIVRASVLGLLTAALPCGWLWAFFLMAAGTGSPIDGAMTMTAFWLGTVPMMLGLGLVARRLSGYLGRRLPVVTAVALIFVGVAALVGRVPMLEQKRLDGTSSGPISSPSCHGD